MKKLTSILAPLIFLLCFSACSSYGDHPPFVGDEDPESVEQLVERAVTVERASNVYGQGIPGGGGAIKTACYGTDVCFVTTNGAITDTLRNVSPNEVKNIFRNSRGDYVFNPSDAPGNERSPCSVLVLNSGVRYAYAPGSPLSDSCFIARGLRSVVVGSGTTTSAAARYIPALGARAWLYQGSNRPDCKATLYNLSASSCQ